jgi:hypothetical protein
VLYVMASGSLVVVTNISVGALPPYSGYMGAANP